MFNYSTLNNDKLEYVSIGSVSEVKDGGRLFIEIDGKPIVIINLGDQYYAIADVCSHDDGPVGEGALEELLHYPPSLTSLHMLYV
jgi:nitrite reductase/ring-hydroxylating ferredoxin subunit